MTIDAAERSGAAAPDRPGSRRGTDEGDAKQRVPAIEGWFTMDAEQPHLIGSKCASCGTYAFPAASHFCGNPACAGTEFDTVELSRTGTVWSYTDNRYQPPEPYISPDPFEPYVIAAVQLAEEGLVILGQLTRGATTDDVAVGDQVELVLEPLYEDDEAEHLVWKWKLADRADDAEEAQP